MYFVLCKYKGKYYNRMIIDLLARLIYETKISKAEKCTSKLFPNTFNYTKVLTKIMVPKNNLLLTKIMWHALISRDKQKSVPTTTSCYQNIYATFSSIDKQKGVSDHNFFCGWNISCIPCLKKETHKSYTF